MQMKDKQIMQTSVHSIYEWMFYFVVGKQQPTIPNFTPAVASYMEIALLWFIDGKHMNIYKQ